MYLRVIMGFPCTYAKTLVSSVSKRIVSQIPLHQYIFLLHIIDDAKKFVRVLRGNHTIIGKKDEIVVFKKLHCILNHKNVMNLPVFILNRVPEI